ncbi:MAG: DUF2299 family protein [Candidatus Hydrothermarchaeota archaeon]|nr:DUF2299 family protein [Candidatus Hydrothermarchaeota archaeon]
MAKKNIKKMVKKWCEEEGIFDEENEDPLSEFNFTMAYPIEIQHKMNVIQPADTDRVVIMAGTRFESKDVEKMRSLPLKKFEDLMWELRFILGSRPTDFNLRRPEDVLESFVITTAIYLDGLTKDRFMTAIGDVYKSKLLASWKLQERLGE